MAKSRAVNRILHIINSTRFNEEQQVIALQQAAAVHPKYRHIFKLTGLIDSKEYDTNMEYDDMIQQIKVMIVEARKTNHAKGRATDD